MQTQQSYSDVEQNNQTEIFKRMWSQLDEARSCSFAVRTQPIQQLEWHQIWIKGLLPSCVAVFVTARQSDRSPYLSFVHSQFVQSQLSLFLSVVLWPGSKSAFGPLSKRLTGEEPCKERLF